MAYKTNKSPLNQVADVMPRMGQTPINPKAFGNPDTIKNVYGMENPGTFTRNVKSSGMNAIQMDNQAMSQDMPQMPPQGVQTSITPNVGFENN